MTISRERGCDELRDRILTLFEEQVAAGVLLPTAVPCGPLTEADFSPDTPSEQVQSSILIFGNYCGDFASTCGE